MNRRLAVICGASLMLLQGCDDEKKNERASDNHKTEFRALDRWVEDFIKKYKLPGGAIAVTCEGRLVHAQGFGFASPSTGERFKPDTLARVGSLSKLITSSAILKLVERGQVDLDARVFGAGGVLSNFTVPGDADPLLRNITVRDFLTMTSGWNPQVVGDSTVPPTLLEVQIETGTPLPPPRRVASGGMLDRELSFRPGTEYFYLNASPIFLSEIIARRTGVAYEEFVAKEFLRPTGLLSPRIGTTRRAHRPLGEATYDQSPLAPSLYPGDGVVPLSYAYGLLDLHLIGPTGGWLFSAVDMAQLFAHLEGTRSPELITPALRSNYNTRPPGVKTWRDTSIFYGFHTENFDNGEFWGKYGSMPGVAAWVGHFSDKFSVAIILNGRDLSAPEVFEPPFAGTTFDRELRDGIRAQLREIKGDLEGDLFESKFQPGRPAFTGPAVAVGKIGSPFQYELTALPDNARFSMDEKIPGLELNANTGHISGTPAEAGQYLAEVSASSRHGSDTATLDVRIGTPGNPIQRGAGFCPVENQYVLRDGRVVDVVLLQGPELVVNPRDGIGVQVLLEDEDGDLVVAELEGAGRLTIRLASNAMVDNPVVGRRLAKGNAELQLSGNDSSSILRFYAYGAFNSDARAGGNAMASGRRLRIEPGAVGSLILGNSEFVGDAGVAGIDAQRTRVAQSLTLGEINAAGPAVPTLKFAETNLVFFLGSRLRQDNGLPIQVSGITEVETFFGANANGKVEPDRVPDARFVQDGRDITKQLFP